MHLACYHPSISSSEAKARVSPQPIGSFLLRSGQSHSGLSVTVRCEVATKNYALRQRGSGAWQLENSNPRSFPSLEALLAFYAASPLSGKEATCLSVGIPCPPARRARVSSSVYEYAPGGGSGSGSDSSLRAATEVPAGSRATGGLAGAATPGGFIALPLLSAAARVGRAAEDGDGTGGGEAVDEYTQLSLAQKMDHSAMASARRASHAKTQQQLNAGAHSKAAPESAATATLSPLSPTREGYVCCSPRQGRKSSTAAIIGRIREEHCLG